MGDFAITGHRIFRLLFGLGLVSGQNFLTGFTGLGKGRRRGFYPVNPVHPVQKSFLFFDFHAAILAQVRKTEKPTVGF
jgi:hypothetical protein